MYMVPIEGLLSQETCHTRVHPLFSLLLLRGGKCSQPRTQGCTELFSLPKLVLLPVVCQRCRCSTMAAEGQVLNVCVFVKTIDSELLRHKCRIFCTRASVCYSNSHVFFRVILEQILKHIPHIITMY